MFPDEELLEENISLTEENGIEIFNGKAFLFDFKVGDFVYKNGAPIVVEGKEALKVWIEKCIRTVKFRAIVHKNLEYGPQIDDLIGSSFDIDFIKAEIDREVSEALLRNAYITGINEFTFELEGDLLTANITVDTIYDEPVEVNI